MHLATYVKLVQQIINHCYNPEIQCTSVVSCKRKVCYHWCVITASRILCVSHYACNQGWFCKSMQPHIPTIMSDHFSNVWINFI